MQSKLERWKADAAKADAWRNIVANPVFVDAVDTAFQIMAEELRTQKAAGDNLQGACKLKDILLATMTDRKSKEDTYGLVHEREL